MELSLDPEARMSSGFFSSHNRVRHLLTDMIDLVFPPSCAGCGRVDEYWCATCADELDHVPLHIHLRQIDLFTGLASSGDHLGKLQLAVQALKYHNTLLVKQPLGKRLADCARHLEWTFDTIIPVPIHAARLKERGYNQAKQIADVTAHQLSKPCLDTALHRQRFTQSQVGLSAAERALNVTDAFIGDPSQLTGKTILLIDDVLTTGATLTACAAAALDAGAIRVYGLTVTAALG